MSGWPIRAIAVGVSSTLVASEKSLIAFGPSPTHGELGYGEAGPKSSVVSRMCDGCDDLHAFGVSVGLGHSLAIVDTTVDGGKAAIEAMPVFAPEEVSGSGGGGGGGKGGSSKKKKKKRKRKAESDSGSSGGSSTKGKGKKKSTSKGKKKQKKK